MRYDIVVSNAPVEKNSPMPEAYLKLLARAINALQHAGLYTYGKHHTEIHNATQYLIQIYDNTPQN